MATRMVAAPRNPQEQLTRRQSLATSPFQDYAPPTLNTSPESRARCPECGAEFVNARNRAPSEWLGEHLEVHQSVPPKVREEEIIAVAAELAAARIAELEAGTAVNQQQIMSWTGTAKRQASALVQRLTEAGVLRRRASGSGGYHRVEVA